MPQRWRVGNASAEQQAETESRDRATILIASHVLDFVEGGVRVPLTIIRRYLGVGKTTLVNPSKHLQEEMKDHQKHLVDPVEERQCTLVEVCRS